MFTENSQGLQKTPKIYLCKECDYTTSRKNDYKKHLNSIKHINMENCLHQNSQKFICKCCNKEYKCRQSLWKHKQKCINNEDDNKSEKSETDSELSIVESNTMVEFMKQNQEFQKEMFNQMMEFMRTQCVNNINNGTINNTQFNLQLYLNETCKNAMTIDEFIEYLQPTVEELEATARLGYVEGITRIIMRGLKDLEEELRPFHCSDLKRETVFVKNSEGIWEKETDEKPQLMKAVKAVGHKNFKNLALWKQDHPNWKCHDSKQNDQYNLILVNSMSGSTEAEQKSNYEKIVKNIAKEIVIDKSKKNKKK
jgi:hypothetical protein